MPVPDGTKVIQLALEALGNGAYDEVIVPGPAETEEVHAELGLLPGLSEQVPLPLPRVVHSSCTANPSTEGAVCITMGTYGSVAFRGG